MIRGYRFKSGILRARMKLAMDALELSLVNVSVDLSGRQIGVPQKLLNDAKVRSAGEKMRGETVP